jgi:DNA-binding NarL/FixJ family response regulator
VLTAAIVENNISFREMLKSHLLSQFPSVEVLEAGDGEELFKKLPFSPVDLIFMDIGLRGENGLELTRKIKADRQDISIIILSSYDFPEYRQAALSYGVNGYILKDSLKWEDISKAIRCHLEAKRDGRKPACIQLVGQ